MPQTQLLLTPADVGLKLSAAEFAAAETRPPFRYERVKGRVAVMSPAGPMHRRASRPFQRKLDHYWEEHQDVVDFVDIEGWVATSPDDDRLPDICVYLKSSATGKDVPQRVPDIVFEIVSDTVADRERDYIHKREEYHQLGVKEYVIVDRVHQKLMVLNWAPDDYEEKMLGSNDVYSTPLLPGLEIPLAESLQG